MKQRTNIFITIIALILSINVALSKECSTYMSRVKDSNIISGMDAEVGFYIGGSCPSNDCNVSVNYMASYTMTISADVNGWPVVTSSHQQNKHIANFKIKKLGSFEINQYKNFNLNPACYKRDHKCNLLKIKILDVECTNYKSGSSKYRNEQTDLKCGEGKCGSQYLSSKCGEGRCGSQTSSSKCGEGKCGSQKTDLKCGEGKCDS